MNCSYYYGNALGIGDTVFDATMNQHALTELLLFLLRNNANRCPPKKLLNGVNEARLEELARENKCLPSLFHLLDCQKCAAEISPSFRKKLRTAQKAFFIASLLYPAQKKAILEEFKKNNLPVCMLKDFSVYPKVVHHRSHFWGSDIDLLIKPNHKNQVAAILKKLGYSARVKRQFETTFSKNGALDIDVHTLSCDFDPNFQLLSRNNLEYLSEKLLGDSKTNGQPKMESFLVFLIVHFWINDCLKRIRTLYDIACFIREYKGRIDWKNVLSLGKAIHFEKQILFVLHMANFIFSAPLPKKVRVPKSNRLFYALIRYHHQNRVIHFPNSLSWWKNSSRESKVLHEQCYLTHFFLKEESLPLALFKPKALLFLGTFLLSPEHTR